jgi:two-component system, OmpR family, sensor histidine kinase QseC
MLSTTTTTTTSTARPRPQALPSLIRRVLVTVLLSFVIVFVVLFGWLGWAALARDTGELDRGLLDTARAFATLHEHEHRRAPAAAVDSTLRLFDVLPASSDPADDPPSHLLLADLEGRVLGTSTMAGAAAADPPRSLAGVPDGAHSLPGSRWRLYTVSTATARVALLDDEAQRRAHITRFLFTDLATYIGMALPLVLLPVWAVAAMSLRPLQTLSQVVAARTPLDTTPLPMPRRWRELATLQDALNHHFERGAASLARERQFVNEAAHELRTPLAVIAAEAQASALADTERRGATLQRLHAAVARAAHLSQRLLQLAQADRHTLGPAQTFDLMDLLRDALALAEPQAQSQGSEVVLDGPDRHPVQSWPALWRAIVDNLVDNALRHGGRNVQIRVRLHADAPRALRLSVHDTGPGIAAAERERVFERFHRGAQASVAGVPGSGLGLAIVRQAARSLGGEAFIEPVTSGTRVVVLMPASAAPSASTQASP